MVRAAIVGLGFMGKTHLGIYSRLPDVEVVALCDTRDENLRITSLDAGGNIRTAGTSGQPIDLSSVHTYTDYALLLADGGFDFVDICLPTFLHAGHAVRALEAGYHVLCEKPIALTRSESDRMIDASERSGRILSVGHCLRYWPAYVAVKELVDSGRFGRVHYAELARFSAPPGWTREGWVRQGARSGNAALDLHIHDTDMVLHLFGAPESVRSEGVFEADGSIAHISTLYRYAERVVQATGGWLCADSFGFTMRELVVLERATIALDFARSPSVTVYPAGGTPWSPELAAEDGYYFELKSFVDGVARGSAPAVATARSSAQSLELCLLEIESARRHEELAVT